MGLEAVKRQPKLTRYRSVSGCALNKGHAGQISISESGRALLLTIRQVLAGDAVPFAGGITPSPRRLLLP